MRHSRATAASTLIFAVILGVAPIASADLLVLKNGDRITGEIKAIWDNEISIEPAYADEFDVDAEVVDYIESDREFEIEMSDGLEIVASLKGEDNQGNQIFVVNGEQVTAPLATLYELDEIDDPVEWDSYVDWSAAVNRGNTDSLNTKFAADSELLMGDHRHIGALTISREDQDGITTKEQDLVRYDYNWLFNDPWFLSAVASFERDPIKDLDQRFVLTAGLGRDIWNTPRLSLNIQLGVGAISEEISGSNDSSTVAQWALRYRQDIFSEDFEIYHNDSIVYYIDGRTNTIIKTSTGLRYEITDLLYANFSVDFDYETEPAATATNEDVSVLFGLGVEF